MEKDLEALSSKVNELVAAVGKLREENKTLRQQLASKTDENTRLHEKVESAAARLEAVLSRLPEKTEKPDGE